MNQSEDIKDLAAALAKAQGQMENAKKDSEAAVTNTVKRKYADLASVWDACRAALSENGLAVTQVTEGGPTSVTVHTRLMHLSGQWLEGSLTMTPQQLTPQGLGSCITYCRRYALSAMVGVCPDDDDGQAASQPAQNGPRPVEQKSTEPTPHEHAQRLAKMIVDLKNAHNLTDDEVKHYGQLASLKEAVNKAEVTKLTAAWNLLNELVIIKQREAAEAS